VLVRVNTSVVVVTPLLKLTSEDAAVIVKVPTWTVITVDAVVVPLVPVIVTA
jgi:hypothetical protein